tara:strand:- start:13414 stop:13662 length:249 start_codon:yes stop_codon:yes gene_type:complete
VGLGTEWLNTERSSMNKLAWIAITVSRALCFLIGAAILGYFILAAANREDWFIIFTGLIVGGPIMALAFVPSPIKFRSKSIT